MRHLKMLGFAAIAALGLLAFAGASTASATKLCTEAACGVVYPAGTTIEATLKAKSTTSLTVEGTAVDTCTESTLAGRTTNEEEEKVFLGIETLTWGNCTGVTKTIAKGSLSFEETLVPNEAKVAGVGTEVTVGIFGSTCTYGFGTLTNLGNLTGGSQPVLTVVTGVARVAGGFLCPKSGIWDAEYTFTKPHAIFIG